MSGPEASQAMALADLELEHADLIEHIQAAATLAERVRIKAVMSQADGFVGDVRPYLKAVWPIAFETGGTEAEAAQAVLKVRRVGAQATEKLKATLRTPTQAEAVAARLIEEREEAFAAGVAAEIRRAALEKQKRQRTKRQRRAERKRTGQAAVAPVGGLQANHGDKS